MNKKLEGLTKYSLKEPSCNLELKQLGPDTATTIFKGINGKSFEKHEKNLNKVCGGKQ